MEGKCKSTLGRGIMMAIKLSSNRSQLAIGNKFPYCCCCSVFLFSVGRRRTASEFVLFCSYASTNSATNLCVFFCNYILFSVFLALRKQNKQK